MTKKATIAEKLRYRILIEKEVEISDNAGGYSASWISVANIWAAIKPVSNRVFSSENNFAMQLENSSSFVFTIRYLEGINSKMRISYNGRLFNIKRVVNVDEESAWIEFLAVEGEAV